MRPILILCLLCSACVHHEEYPDDWSPAEVSSTGCPDISGTYELLGHCVNPNPDFPYKPHLLNTHFSIDGHWSLDSLLTITQVNEKEIKVVARHGGRLSEPLLLSLDDHDFECKDGKLWISHITGVPPLSVFSAPMAFLKADDGSLVGEARQIGAVLFYIIPIPVSSTDYCRWEASDTD